MWFGRKCAPGFRRSTGARHGVVGETSPFFLSGACGTWDRWVKLSCPKDDKLDFLHHKPWLCLHLKEAFLNVSFGIIRFQNMQRNTTRTPLCGRCLFHVPGDRPPRKGHKKVCPYRNCKCPGCESITNRTVNAKALSKAKKERQRKATMSKPNTNEDRLHTKPGNC